MVVFLSCVGCLGIFFRGLGVILAVFLGFRVMLVVFQVVRQRRGRFGRLPLGAGRKCAAVSGEFGIFFRGFRVVLAIFLGLQFFVCVRRLSSVGGLSQQVLGETFNLCQNTQQLQSSSSSLLLSSLELSDTQSR